MAQLCSYREALQVAPKKARLALWASLIAMPALVPGMFGYLILDGIVDQIEQEPGVLAAARAITKEMEKVDGVLCEWEADPMPPGHWKPADLYRHLRDRYDAWGVYDNTASPPVSRATDAWLSEDHWLWRNHFFSERLFGGMLQYINTPRSLRSTCPRFEGEPDGILFWPDRDYTEEEGRKKRTEEFADMKRGIPRQVASLEHYVAGAQKELPMLRLLRVVAALAFLTPFVFGLYWNVWVFRARREYILYGYPSLFVDFLQWRRRRQKKAEEDRKRPK